MKIIEIEQIIKKKIFLAGFRIESTDLLKKKRGNREMFMLDQIKEPLWSIWAVRGFVIL